MRRLPPHLAPAGYSPRRYAPLSPAPVLGMGERLTDLRDIQQMFARGEQGGYWPADPQYAYEDSAGTTLASVNGVVGKRTDVALGKHAVQSTTANKPYLRRTPATGKTWYDSNTATGALTAAFSGSLGSSCTIATVTPEGVVIADNQTVGTTYNIAQPYGYSSDVLIINRALTAAEKALVTRVMQRSVPTLGSELVTNGGFDTDTSWTKTGAASISGGLGHLSGASSIEKAVGHSINTFYNIKYTAIIRAVSVRAQLVGVQGLTRTTSGSFSEILKAPNSGTTYFVGVSGADADLDNISIKELL